MPPPRRLDRVQERAAVTATIALAVGVTCLPHLYGLLTCPPDRQYLGLIGPFGNDQAFYLGWGPKQAESGEILFEDKFNGHTDARRVFNPLWLAMGWTARVSGLPLLLVFQLERVAFSALLLWQVHAITARFLRGRWWRLTALLLVAFSSGFGVFGVDVADWTARRGLYQVRAWTPDLWVAESNVFLTMLGEVVLPAATALFLLGMRSGLELLTGGRGSPCRLGGLLLLLGTVYPYAVVSAWAILGGLALLGPSRPDGSSRPSRAYLAVVALSSPIVLYDALLVLDDPKLTVGQALYASPGLHEYFLGFGVVSLFALVGAGLALRRRRRRLHPLLVWVGITLAVIYIPRSLVPFQLQLVLGVQVPLTILAVHGARQLWWMSRRRGPRFGLGIALVGSLALAPATSAYHLANVFASLQRRQLPEYLDLPTAEALRWLNAESLPSEVVLSAPETAPYVPVLANNRVYSGDYAAPTAGFAEKQERLAWMLHPGTEPAALVRFLREARIRYVLFDPRLRARSPAGAGDRLAVLTGLERVFERGSVTIFRVTQ